LNVLDLFSGIGGFSLGLERAGMRTVAFCEIDPFCRAILAKNWPDVPVHGDVCALRGIPLSGLVNRRPAEGPLWGSERPALRPDWVVIENVGHTWRRWVPELRRLLYGLGYASVPFRVRASDVGAHHERSRIFVVANADSEFLRQLQGWWSGPGRKMAAELAQSQDFAPRRLGANDGLPDWVDRRRALGNAIVPQIAQIIGAGIMSTERDALIRKLRAAENGGYREETYTKLCGDAADELVRLEALLEAANRLAHISQSRGAD
jgi:DNA (cytosine-5)-methyltransferase 1